MSKFFTKRLPAASRPKWNNTGAIVPPPRRHEQQWGLAPYFPKEFIKWITGPDPLSLDPVEKFPDRDDFNMLMAFQGQKVPAVTSDDQ